MAPLSAAATAALEGALALTHGGLTLRDDVRTLLRDYWAGREGRLGKVGGDVEHGAVNARFVEHMPHCVEGSRRANRDV